MDDIEAWRLAGQAAATLRVPRDAVDELGQDTDDYRMVLWWRAWHEAAVARLADDPARQTAYARRSVWNLCVDVRRRRRTARARGRTDLRDVMLADAGAAAEALESRLQVASLESTLARHLPPGDLDLLRLLARHDGSVRAAHREHGDVPLRTFYRRVQDVRARARKVVGCVD